MKTAFFLSFALLLLGSNSWAHKCPEELNNYPECQGHPTPCRPGRICENSLQNQHIWITGFSCANPWNGEEGPNYASAMSSADRKAEEKCYPFQAHRISEYTLKSDNRICSEHLFGAIASARYSCAQTHLFASTMVSANEIFSPTQFLVRGIGYAFTTDHDEYVEAIEAATSIAHQQCGLKNAQLVSEWKYTGPYKHGYAYVVRAEAFFVCE